MRKVTAEGAAVREARIVAFNLPAIIGLSTSGSFEYMLEALEGQAPADVNNVMSGVIGAASRLPDLLARRPIWRARSKP